MQFKLILTASAALISTAVAATAGQNGCKYACGLAMGANPVFGQCGARAITQNDCGVSCTCCPGTGLTCTAVDVCADTALITDICKKSEKCTCKV